MLLLSLICLLLPITSSSSYGKETNVALLRPSQQSTTFASGQASLAVDGNPESCSSTRDGRSDTQRWWSVQLSGAVNVRDVAITINHQVAFDQQFTVFVIERSGDLRTRFVKCSTFDGLFRAGQRKIFTCPDGGITGEKVYIRDDRREGSAPPLSLCEVEVLAHSSGICSEPPAIANGRVTVLGGTQQQLRYECDPGYWLWGKASLQCRPSNTWSSLPPTCQPITCGYPPVEDPNAVVVDYQYDVEKGNLGVKAGDAATVVCTKGFVMVTNSSVDEGLMAIANIRVECTVNGIWRMAHQYYCVNDTLMSKISPALVSSTSRPFSTPSLIYTLLAIIFFLLLLLVLTFILRRKRVKAIRRRTEAAVTMPRIHRDSATTTTTTKSTRPLISIFTTLDKGSTNLMQSQHSTSNARLISDDNSLGRSQDDIKKKMTYEEDLRLPESGSLVQGISVDPHSAVFGKNGVRLEELERQFQNGLPDVTANFYHNFTGNRTTPVHLSSFQPAAGTGGGASTEEEDEATAQTLWQNNAAWGFIPPPPPPVRPNTNWGGIDQQSSGNEPRQSQLLQRARNLSLPPSSHLNAGQTNIFSGGDYVEKINESLIMAPPTNFITAAEDDRHQQLLPNLDEAGYASLILRHIKTEPVYERIKGERPVSQGPDNVSDSGESHAYYSRVAKDEAQTISMEPPVLKEHLYQNFDQVFLEMEQQKHPDVLNNAIGTESTLPSDDDDDSQQFYENTRTMPSMGHEETSVVVVSDEKLRTMYAQVDVAKKHSDRSHKSLQVVDQVAQDLREMVSLVATNRTFSGDVDSSSAIHTAWEEHI